MLLRSANEPDGVHIQGPDAAQSRNLSRTP